MKDLVECPDCKTVFVVRDIDRVYTEEFGWVSAWICPGCRCRILDNKR